MATDAEVQKKLESVTELRRKITEARDAAATEVRETDNEIQLKLLAREEERLKAELASVERAADVDQEAQVEAVISGPVAPSLEEHTAAAEEEE